MSDQLAAAELEAVLLLLTFLDKVELQVAVAAVVVVALVQRVRAVMVAAAVGLIQNKPLATEDLVGAVAAAVFIIVDLRLCMLVMEVLVVAVAALAILLPCLAVTGDWVAVVVAAVVPTEPLQTAQAVLAVMV
jgi:hypothetical protein